MTCPFFSIHYSEANPLQLAFKINQRYILRVTAFNYKSFCMSCSVFILLFVWAVCVKAVQRAAHAPQCAQGLRLCIGVWLHNVRIALWFICKSGFSSRSLLVISQSFLIISKSVDARVNSGWLANWLVKPTHGLRPNIVWYALCICVCVSELSPMLPMLTMRQLLTFATLSHDGFLCVNCCTARPHYCERERESRI